MYVADSAENAVSVLDGATNAVTATVPVGLSPEGIAVDPLTDTVYVADSMADTISLVGGATDTVTETLRVGADPVAVAVDPATDTVYVANYLGGTVAVIDGRTGAETGAVAVGATPQAIAVDPATDIVYVTHFADNTVSVIDGATSRLIGTLSVGADPKALAVDPATDTVYVANASNDTISVIDGATYTVTATIAVGAGPDAVALDPSTGTVYVGNAGGHSVSLIDGATGAVTETLHLEASPAAIGASEVSHMAYVANELAGSVSVIDGRKAPARPRLTSSSAGDGTLSLGWSPPVSDGGSPLTSYVVAAVPRSGGGAARVVTLAPRERSDTLTGLLDGSSYTITVTARSSIGTGSPSRPLQMTPVAAPEAPGRVYTKAGNHEAKVFFVAPPDNGAAISSYRITAYLGSREKTSVTLDCPCPHWVTATVGRLTDGSTYDFVVTARNRVGTSAGSPPSRPTTPRRFESVTRLRLVLAKISYGDETAERVMLAVSPGRRPMPTGRILVKAGPFALCRVVLSHGFGSCTIACPVRLRPGAYEMRAFYSGGADYKPSASGRARLRVSGASRAGRWREGAALPGGPFAKGRPSRSFLGRGPGEKA